MLKYCLKPDAGRFLIGLPSDPYACPLQVPVPRHCCAVTIDSCFPQGRILGSDAGDHHHHHRGPGDDDDVCALNGSAVLQVHNSCMVCTPLYCRVCHVEDLDCLEVHSMVGIGMRQSSGYIQDCCSGLQTFGWRAQGQR